MPRININLNMCLLVDNKIRKMKKKILKLIHLYTLKYLFEKYLKNFNEFVIINI